MLVSAHRSVIPNIGGNPEASLDREVGQDRDIERDRDRNRDLKKAPKGAFFRI
jgi:hypothetical protein